MRPVDADALETLTYWECFEDSDDDYEYVLKTDIDHAPTIEVEPKWIPISEKTPGAEHVLVTLKWGEEDYEVTELDYAVDVACGGRFAQYVTAWMPLPEPYKEGQAHGDALYPCDPSKNTKCRKTGCFKNGGPCSSTRHAEYAAGGVAKKGV